MTFFHATFWRSRLRHWLLKLISNLAPLAACALPAAAAVPPHERQVLVDLFASTSALAAATRQSGADVVIAQGAFMTTVHDATMNEVLQHSTFVA